MPKMEDEGNIKVCVRVRPFIRQELNGERKGDGDSELRCCISTSSTTSMEIWKDGEPSSPRGYTFDRVFWSHSADHNLYATQETLQSELGETMLANAMDGFNNCIFAYGQTGSGKSYSVLGGKDEERGLLPRVVEGLFEHFDKMDPKLTWKTSVSFLEVYNEQIRDLLQADAKDTRKLDVRTHPVLGVIVPGLTEAPVESSKAVMELIDWGSQMRKVGATSMNENSSRSHCVFTFRTSIKDETSGECKLSSTNLVDLAGSERAKRTQAEGSRLKEGANINQSLSVLARVISSLADKKKAKSAPFRDSKMTHLLKESLSGNSKTVMVAALSPSNWDYDETCSTLKFAQSVKLVQTSAKQNKDNEENIERQLRAEADRLKEQLLQLQSSQRSSEVREEIERFTKQVEEQEELLKRHAPGGWEELLIRERQLRLRRRNASIRMADVDNARLEDIRAEFFKRNPTISFKTCEEASSSGESSVCGEECQADEQQIVLARFLPMTSLGGEPDPLAADDGSADLVVQGSMLGDAEAARQRQLALQAPLDALRQQTAEAHRLLSGGGGTRLRACVVVDLEELSTSLAVRAEHATTEWLCPDELRARLGRLRRSAAAGSHPAWADSAEAARRPTIDIGELAALRRELEEAEAELLEDKAELAVQERALASAHAAPHAARLEGGRLSELARADTKQLARLVEDSFSDAAKALQAAQMAIKGLPAR